MSIMNKMKNLELETDSDDNGELETGSDDSGELEADSDDSGKLETDSDDSGELETDSDDNGNDSDCDVGDSDEIQAAFSKECNLLAETTAVNDYKYVLHIDGTNETSPSLAVGSSGSNVNIFQLSNEQLVKSDSLVHDDGQCIGVSFVKDNSNLLYAGYNNGCIKLWDLRDTKQYVNNFVDTTTENSVSSKPFTCFNVASNNRLLAAGTELCKGDAYILFWDIRNLNLLGAYWESHTDDITQLKFNDEDVNKLMSSSTDGLINIYDLSQNDEDDALTESLNTESSVEQISWFKNKGVDSIFCSTHTFDVQLWKLDDAEPFLEFKRNVLGSGIKRKSEGFSYVAGAYTNDEKNDLFILVGSNYKDGDCLRSVAVENNELRPCHNFIGNKQRVRATWFDTRNNVLITGGEKGTLNAWKLELSKSRKLIKKGKKSQ